MTDNDENLRILREKAESSDQAIADAAAARRELAFVKAGIDTDKGPGKLLFQAYTGDATAEAVTAAAAEYGITPATATEPAAATTTTTPDPTQDPAVAAAVAAAQELTAGGTTPPPDPADQDKDWDKASEAFNRARAVQGDEDRAAAPLVHTAIANSRAGNGWNPKTGWTAEQLEAGRVDLPFTK